MKKYMFFIMILVLSLCMFACDNNANTPVNDTDVIPETDSIHNTQVETNNVFEAETDVFLFPNDTYVCGVDISGLDVTGAYNKLSGVINEYTVTLNVNNNTFNFTSDELGIKVIRSSITCLYNALLKGETPVDNDKYLMYDLDVVSTKISKYFNRNVVNASVRYDTSQGKFVATTASEGKVIDTAPVVAAAENAILYFEGSADISAEITVNAPTFTPESEKVKSAVSAANNYLGIVLTYRFAPENAAPAEVTLTKDRIASFISVNNSYEVIVDKSAIEAYASKLSDEYSVAGETGNFIATGGYEIGLSATYSGQPVDTSALADDMYNCIISNTSGVRIAPYLSRESADKPFNGNYVEINLSAQYLWVYRGGVCVASTPIVSGCAFNGWNTPTGVYSVNDKTPGCYLNGATYSTWVNYWIGFIGNSYGIHDATWRDTFGGDIYLYNGSHGCVNIPYGAAATIYNNVTLGTKVVLYGGATNADPVEQKISGTGEYKAADDSTPFKIDAAVEYADAQLKYSSDNPAVAEVSADGTVTVKGIGTATIKVTCEAVEYYTAAEFTVKITVTSACIEGRHKFGEWVQVTAPTCVMGAETRKCSDCTVSENRSIAAAYDHTPGNAETVKQPNCTEQGLSVTKCSVCGIEMESSAIPATGHKFIESEQYCAYGCGTVNPSYSAPPEDNNTEVTPPAGDNNEQTPPESEVTPPDSGGNEDTPSGGDETPPSDGGTTETPPENIDGETT